MTKVIFLGRSPHPLDTSQFPINLTFPKIYETEKPGQIGKLIIMGQNELTQDMALLRRVEEASAYKYFRDYKQL